MIDERRGGSPTIGRAGPLLRYRHTAAPRPARACRLGSRASRTSEHARDETFGAAAARGSASPTRAIDRFWDVFIRPALNLRTDEVERRGRRCSPCGRRCSGRGASDLVLPIAPLGEMHGEAAHAGARGRGRDVRSGPVRDRRAAVGRRRRRTPSSSPCRRDETARLLGEAVPALEDSPIVSVHLLFDRRCCGTSSPRCSAAPRTGSSTAAAHRARAGAGPVPDGRLQRRAGAARDPRPRARRPDGRRADRAPRAGRAALVARQPRARGDVRAAPGPRPSRRRRPAARTSRARARGRRPAGRATMESAVRSGRAAARACWPSRRTEVAA